MPKYEDLRIDCSLEVQKQMMIQPVKDSNKHQK